MRMMMPKKRLISGTFAFYDRALVDDSFSLSREDQVTPVKGRCLCLAIA